MINRGHIELAISPADLTVMEFNSLFPCYRQTPAVEKYYHEHNSSVWQLLDESPRWVDDIARQVPQDFTHHVVSITRLDPGQTIPYHMDHHAVLREKFGEGDTWRYLVFLEDWKQGHYFEIQNEPVVKWRAGDWIKFSRDEWHLGGNMGSDPFYSVQITVK